ncbi:hypothetical protein B7494_g3609 [Chlorociboria aeruginascens]|nr:hypothetical protein B7494_g3609 [Chlorociboria aeruginascens]
MDSTMDPTLESTMASVAETPQEEAPGSRASEIGQKRALQQSPRKIQSGQIINLDFSDGAESPYYFSKKLKYTYEQDTYERPQSPLRPASPSTADAEITRNPEASLPTVTSWNKGVQTGIRAALRTSFSSGGSSVSTAVLGNEDAPSQLLSSQKAPSTSQDSIRVDQSHVSVVPLVETIESNTPKYTVPSSTQSEIETNNRIHSKRPKTNPGISKPDFAGKEPGFPTLKGEAIYRNGNGDFMLSEVLLDGEHIFAKNFDLAIFVPAFLTDNLAKVDTLKTKHVRGAFTTYIDKYYNNCKSDTAPARELAGTKTMAKLIHGLLQEKRSELAKQRNFELSQQNNSQLTQQQIKDQPINEPSIQQQSQESNTAIKTISRPGQGTTAPRANYQSKSFDPDVESSTLSFHHDPNSEREPLLPSDKRNSMFASNSGPRWRPPPTMVSSHEAGNGPALISSSEYYNPISVPQKEKQGDENQNPGHPTSEYHEASVATSGEFRDLQGTILNESHQDSSMQTVHSSAVYGNDIEMGGTENSTWEKIAGGSTTNHDALDIELSEVELKLQMKYFPSVDRSKHYCLACAEAGHRTVNCPYLTCSACGVTGYHTTAACPLNQRCGKCWQHGHSTSQCQEKLLPSKDETGGCTLCNSEDHLEWACHLIWRSFNPKPEEIVKVRGIPVSCYFCGGIGHFGADCGLRIGPIASGGITWSQANLQKYLEPSSRQRAIFAAPDYSIPSKPKKDLSIKGRANDPITLDDSDSDDVTFIQAKIAKSGAKHGSISIKGKGVVSLQKDTQRILAVDSARYAHERTFSPPPRYAESINENYRPQLHPQNNGQNQAEGYDRPIQDFYLGRYDGVDDEPASAGANVRGGRNRGRGRRRGAGREGANTNGGTNKNSDEKDALNGFLQTMANFDLLTLGQTLVTSGPHKIEGTPRRVRGLFGSKFIFDTTSALFVWEHKYYPYFYIRASEFPSGALAKSISMEGYWVGRLSVGGKSTERVLGFEDGLEGEGKALSGLVRVEVGALEAWFVEDEKLLGPHPKDPYKRIECISSSREIRVELEGVVIAKSKQNIFLYETMLRSRFYLQPTDVGWEVLSESETTSFCPYKGMANYYNVAIEGQEIKDAVWYYKYPTAESSPIAGRLCFYNEKFDVFIDGVKEEK